MKTKNMYERGAGYVGYRLKPEFREIPAGTGPSTPEAMYYLIKSELNGK